MEKRATISDKLKVLFLETEVAKQNQKFSLPFFFSSAGCGGNAGRILWIGLNWILGKDI